MVLPTPSPLERPHYDLAFYQLSIRNVANFTPPAMPLREGVRPEWRTMLQIAGIAAGAGPDADVDAFDEMVALDVARRETVTAGLAGRGHGPGRRRRRARRAARPRADPRPDAALRTLRRRNSRRRRAAGSPG